MSARMEKVNLLNCGYYDDEEGDVSDSLNFESTDEETDRDNHSKKEQTVSPPKYAMSPPKYAVPSKRTDCFRIFEGSANKPALSAEMRFYGD